MDECYPENLSRENEMAFWGAFIIYYQCLPFLVARYRVIDLTQC